MTMTFRKLRADEVDVRIGTLKEGNASLLLYKDARCDMAVLDETVGPMNWQRLHTRDNHNCIVSIWDGEKGMWINKEDTGVESNAEAQKGLASDSFKRACVNWGIGRELYTAPFIWVKGVDKFDKFWVTHIGYDENGVITELEIRSRKTKRAVFSMNVNAETYPAALPRANPRTGPHNMEQAQFTLSEIHTPEECYAYGVAQKELGASMEVRHMIREHYNLLNAEGNV